MLFFCVFFFILVQFRSRKNASLFCYQKQRPIAPTRFELETGNLATLQISIRTCILPSLVKIGLVVLEISISESFHDGNDPVGHWRPIHFLLPAAAQCVLLFSSLPFLHFFLANRDKEEKPFFKSMALTVSSDPRDHVRGVCRPDLVRVKSVPKIIARMKEKLFHRFETENDQRLLGGAAPWTLR